MYNDNCNPTIIKTFFFHFLMPDGLASLISLCKKLYDIAALLKDPLGTDDNCRGL